MLLPIELCLSLVFTTFAQAGSSRFSLNHASISTANVSSSAAAPTGATSSFKLITRPSSQEPHPTEVTTSSSITSRFPPSAALQTGASSSYNYASANYTSSSNFTCMLPDYMGFTAACQCSSLYHDYSISQTTDIITSTYLITENPFQVSTHTELIPNGFENPSDCCRCYPQAGTVQVIFWPVETSTSEREESQPRITSAPQPYELISDGFTYTSPYVYVKYSALSAAKLCVGVGLWSEPPGSYDTISSYLPNELSTAGCDLDGVHTYTAINYTELQYSSSSTCKEFGTFTLPYLSVPTDMINIDPAWSTCTYFGMYLAYDPPRALQKASALVNTQSPNPPAQKTSAPSPGARVNSPSAQATATPAVVAPQPDEDTTPPSQGSGSNGNSGSNSVNSDAVSNPNPNPGVAPGKTPQANQNPSTPDTPTPIIVAGQTALKAANGDLVLGTLRLPPSSSATLKNQVIANQGSNIVVSGSGTISMIPIPTSPPGTPVLATASQTAVRASNGDIILGSLTIPSSATVTFNGEIIANHRSNIIVSDASTTSTVPVPNIASAHPLTSLLTLDGQTFTAVSGGIAIGGKTLEPGSGAITLANGDTASLGADGWLHAGSSSTDVSSESTMTGVGGMVAFGFGRPSGVADSGGSNESATVPFTGDAPQLSDLRGMSQLLTALLIFVGIMDIS